MTVFPGSLDYLYYNGVLDHIPYEAYEMLPVQPNRMQSGLPQLGNIKQSILGNQGMDNFGISNNVNNSNYLGTAMKGQMYGYYGNSNDSFVGSNHQHNGTNQPTMQMYGGGYYGRGPVSNGLYNTGSPYPNNYGSSSYSNPPSVNNPYGNGSVGAMPDNGIYNRYDRRLQNGSGNDIKDLIASQAKDSKTSVLNSSPLLKGLLATAIIIATPLLIFRGKKSVSTNPSRFKNFFSKINPVNWFKGKFDFSKLNPKNWFKRKPDWSKFNPKNWFKKKP